MGFLSLWINPRRLARSCVLVSPETILKFHRFMVKRKYRRLFSPKQKKKPGPKGPSPELIELVVKIKIKNSNYGCEKIAFLVSKLLDEIVDDQTIRRILRKYYKPPCGKGPSWLTFLGHMKDSLWSVDLFCCESTHLKTHWVMVIMDQFTRKIIGFSVHCGPVDGLALCCMFNKIVGNQGFLPKRLSFDHDPLFRYSGWKRTLRIYEVLPIRTVVECAVSHPFIERLIKTVRDDYLNYVSFWNARDLEKKLKGFLHYYNHFRVHFAHNGKTPGMKAGESVIPRIDLRKYNWKSHCRGLYCLPIAA
jgi:transposase InsO family protein